MQARATHNGRATELISIAHRRDSYIYIEYGPVRCSRSLQRCTCEAALHGHCSRPCMETHDTWISGHFWRISWLFIMHLKNLHLKQDLAFSCALDHPVPFLTSSTDCEDRPSSREIWQHATTPVCASVVHKKPNLFIYTCRYVVGGWMRDRIPRTNHWLQ